LNITVSADATENDPKGDVAHWEYSNNIWGWSYKIGDKPDIDITELSYSISGDELTLIMKVDGVIKDSEKVWYWCYLNTSDASYWMSFMNGEGGGMALNTGEGSMKYDWEPEISVSGSTFSCKFDIVGSDYSKEELWGYAAEYIEAGDITKEWWGDWAPAEYSPFWGEDDGENENGDDGNGEIEDDENINGSNNDQNTASDTPGYEFMVVFIAIASVFLVIKRKK
jgi:hypothetical protein